MSDKAYVLAVDDKENMLKLFERILGDAHAVTLADSGTRAISLLSGQTFDVVLSDVRMPGADGFEVLAAVKKISPDTEVILVTAHASVPRAVEAIKLGAYDYIQKPFDPDDLALVVARAVERRRLRLQTTQLRRELEGVFGFDNIIGKSPPMRQLFHVLARAAELDLTVLISGETGTGKELVAHALHHASARKGQPFIPVNCGALPADLIESELFGHAKGSFTGATDARRGLFEEAAKGTIFLDEIGELPLHLQVKLNRALENREIRRVGESQSRRFEARVVAATHRDLRAEVAAGRFREDLFYRLNAFPIALPALRERSEDIPVLAQAFLERAAKQFGRELAVFDPETLRVLVGYPWPGNVRELQNAVERAVALTTGRTVVKESLPAELLASSPQSLPPAEQLARLPYREAIDIARERVSRDYLLALLQEFAGNVTRAAERAGMERESLHRLMKRYGVRSDDFKRPERAEGKDE